MKFPSALAVLFLVVGVAAGGAVAQADDPAWADEVHADLERGAATHNAWVEREEPSFVGDRFAENEHVTLTVSDEGDAAAVYSVHTDDEMRVTDVNRGPARDETMRAFASKPALEDVAQADNPAAAFGDAVASGDIRVERPVDVGGHELALGPMDGLLGVLGFGVGAALLGVVGVGTLLSVPGLVLSRGFEAIRSALRGVVDGLKALLKVLAHLLAAVEALQLLGFRVRERIQSAARRVRARLRALGGSLRARLAALDDMAEREERDGEGVPQRDDGQ